MPDTAGLVSMVQQCQGVHARLPPRRLSHPHSHLRLTSTTAVSKPPTHPPRRDEIPPGTTPPQTGQGARYRRLGVCVSQGFVSDDRSHTQTMDTDIPHTPIT